jgi:hypothetical protein
MNFKWKFQQHFLQNNIALKFLQDNRPFLLGFTGLAIEIHFQSKLTLGGLLTFYL